MISSWLLPAKVDKKDMGETLTLAKADTKDSMKDGLKDIEEPIQGSNFIPYTFALEKLKVASLEYYELKNSYEEHIIQLKSFHEKHCQQTQTFYEEYIKDMKGKAKYHIEGQQTLRIEMESNLREQVCDIFFI